MSIAVVKYGLFDPVKNAKNYIIDSLKEALIVTDPEYQFLFLNPMAETLVSSTKKLSSINNDPEIYELRSGNNNAESYWKSPSETDLRQLGTAQKTVGIKIMVDHALKNNIPIIFLTGKNDADTVKNVMTLKPDGYLLKNMEPQSLHDAIDRFFAERAEQEN